ncbi:MAG TPA: aminopeptidase [Burkholderiales bacterium]|nr:aminopeptidase [Burkholderiales bacterium]
MAAPSLREPRAVLGVPDELGSLGRRAAPDSTGVRRRCPAAGLRLLAAALLPLAGGCANLGYYLQSVGGQLEIWRRERPIAEAMADPATGAELKRRLARVLEIREFATRELKLPDNRSFRRYAELGRPYAVWNVYAAPEFSVQPLQWCFLFAGCVSYRGYFSREAAERFAAGLAERGYDTHVGGVPAYSTLGWFPDPVLDTFIHFPETEIARLVFHELAHQVAYAPDDTVFNESFAMAVETEGVRRWLARAGDRAGIAEFERARRIREEFARLIADYRARLDALYRSGLEAEAMRGRKRAVLEALQADYRRLREQWGGYAGYDAWFATPPNNARLASVAIYHGLVPAFEALLARAGGDLERFYGEARALAALPKAQREARLRALAP